MTCSALFISWAMPETNRAMVVSRLILASPLSSSVCDEPDPSCGESMKALKASWVHGARCTVTRYTVPRTQSPLRTPYSTRPET